MQMLIQIIDLVQFSRTYPMIQYNSYLSILNLFITLHDREIVINGEIWRGHW